MQALMYFSLKSNFSKENIGHGDFLFYISIHKILMTRLAFGAVAKMFASVSKVVGSSFFLYELQMTVPALNICPCEICVRK